MKKEDIKSFLQSLNYFDNKFLDNFFANNYNVKNIKSSEVYLALDKLCVIYYNKLKKKNNIDDNYLYRLQESVKRAYITEFLNINKYNKEILKNLDNLPNNDLEKIISSIDTCNYLESVGIFIVPDNFNYIDENIKDSIKYSLIK